MSASKDKIIRRQQAAAGNDKRSAAAAKEAAEKRKQNIQYTVVAVVLVIFFAFIFIYNSAWPSRHTTAVTIDGQKYSVAQMNYYYSAAYADYYNQNYIDVLTGQSFNAQESLADQEYEDGVTWRDHFLEEAVDDMIEVQLLNKQAEAAGFTLDEEHEAEYEDALHEIEDHWSENGYSSLQQYINLNYGKGVNMALLEQELRRTATAEAYAESLRDAYEYSDDELAAFYAEHADEYDRITYSYYLVSDDTVDADALAEAIKGFTAEEFETYMEENYDGATPSTLTYSGEQLPETYSEWLLSADRQPGDSTVATDDDGSTSYVVLFLERSVNDYNLVNFRHILINAEDTDEDGTMSEEELAAAVAEAEDIRAEWEAGAATEDSFAELANAKTDDTGSNTTGGLYEDVYQDQMVENVNDWIFDEARKPGDVEIVTNEGSYTGAHLLYFVGTADETYATSLARDNLSNADYEEWIDGQKSAYTATTSHLGMCGKNH